MEFTAKNVQGLKLKAGQSEAFFWDDDVPGFGIRLRDGGSRNWVFQYRLGGKQRRMTLGSVDAISLKQARDGQRDHDGKILRHGAADLHALVKLGGDPAGDTKQAKKDAGSTFKALTTRFLEDKKATLKPRSYAEVERHLLGGKKSSSPTAQLHQMQIGKIARGDVKECLRVVAKKGKVTANRVQSTLSTFFGWCVEHDYRETNPVIEITPYEEKSRERVLTPGELRIIWQSLPDNHYGAIVKLLALTAQREAEIGGLRRSELNEDGDTADLPPERTKNSRRHFVPLPAPARAIIEAQPVRTDGDGKVRDLIFGVGDGPFSGWSNSKEALDAAITERLGKPLPHWTIHDIRRSVSTYLGGGLGDDEIRKLPATDRPLAEGLQVEPHVIEAVLNHVSGVKAGVHGIYNRSPYSREKRQALDLWADRLLAIVEDRDSNVKTLRRA